MKQNRSRDLRAYARQTNTRLVLGALLLLFLLGDGLIYIIYGKGAALMGLTCILGGMVPIVLVVVILSLLDWIQKRANPE